MKQAPRPYRNQRLFRPKQRRQQHLLEVSLRADKERALRVKRVSSVIFKFVLLAALSVGAWVGTKEALRRLVWENRTFYLSDPQVRTDGVLTKEQIMAAAGVIPGRNIFLFDLAKIRTKLDALPQVERVTVDRTLPNRIDIEVTERQPIAWVAAPRDTDPTASERSFLIDARGYVMKTGKLLPYYYSLPVITGFETENLVAGQKVSAFEVQAALELLRLNTDNTRWQVRNIDVSKGYCLVVTDRGHAKITFGLDNIERQLTRFHRLMEVIEPAREIRTVNLLVERNTPVTFVEPGLEESPDPAANSSTSKPDAKAGDKAPSTNLKADPKTKPAKEKTGSGPTPAAGRKSESNSGGKPLKKPFRLQSNG